MKKVLILLVALVLLLISVSSVSANRQRCMQYDFPVRIIAIEPDDRIIKANYLFCVTDPWGGGGYDVVVWLYVPDTTKIRFLGEDWNATFDNLSTEGQRIDFSFQAIDFGVFHIEGIAKTITIYPD